LINEKLFDTALLEPVERGGNRLYIVSGYATSAMAFHHLNQIQENGSEIQVRLIVGMCPEDGISKSNHRGFQKLMNTDFEGLFQCSYIYQKPPVHSKVYSWFADDEPLIGFVGSPNYTQKAFSSRQREILSVADPLWGMDYFNVLDADSVYCTHNDAENLINVFLDKIYRRTPTDAVSPRHGFMVSGLPSVTVSLLDREGDLPQRSGLNWGQRPEVGREPNQAYIKLASDIYHTYFFPERTVHFTVHTDDDKTLICTRAQDNGKAIHTPHNNSLIGEYFRKRLGVAFGDPVTTDDLIKYGRTNLTFYKIDDETYYMDFSV